MKEYLDLLRKVRTEGVEKADRTGTGTLSLFGYQLRCRLAEGFPLVTTKRVHVKSIIHELLWFLKGDTNIAYLKENGVRIWDEWATPEGDLGPVYGAQWRAWPTPAGAHIDQMSNLVEEIKRRPHSRRLLISAWNPAVLPDESVAPAANAAAGRMALAPCHTMFQFYVQNGELSLQLYQRSADVFLGVPFNIASYALLTLMMAQVTGLKPGEFIHTFGDVHLYLNHLEQADTQLARAPLSKPQLRLNPAVSDLFAFEYHDFELLDYQSHPPIRAAVSV